jgi:hypothetical protein
MYLQFERFLSVFDCKRDILRSVCRLLVTANVVPSSPILVTLMMEALLSSQTSVLIRATRRNIPEDKQKQTNSVAFSPQANYTD